MIYDVAIVGLGPAGSTLARLLSPKLKVIGIDKKAIKKRVVLPNVVVDYFPMMLNVRWLGWVWFYRKMYW